MEDRLINELVTDVAGTDVVFLVNLILGKRDVNEFKIAEEMKITVNQVRNMLYRLSAHNLVDFTRKKDKRKGWYIYFWTFDARKAHELILMLKKKKLVLLKKKIEKELKENYLSCPNKCVRFDTTQAMEYDFRCPECNELLAMEDPMKNADAIDKEIKQIELDIAEEEKKMIEVQKERARTERKLAGKKPKPKKKKLKLKELKAWKKQFAGKQKHKKKHRNAGKHKRTKKKMLAGKRKKMFRKIFKRFRFGKFRKGRKR